MQKQIQKRIRRKCNVVDWIVLESDDEDIESQWNVLTSDKRGKKCGPFGMLQKVVEPVQKRNNVVKCFGKQQSMAEGCSYFVKTHNIT